MTDIPAVVIRTRAGLRSIVAAHEWPSPEVQERVTQDVLTLIATIPHRGDDDAYLRDVEAMAGAMLNPLVVESRILAEFRRMPPITETIQ